MNKKMLAMAVAAAMVAPMTAQAEVNVYGKFKMGMAMVNDGTNSGMAVTTDASRLGFKGSKELENGMTALYQLEGEVKPDVTGYSMGRNMYVGLKAGFGTIRLGHFDTSYKVITGKMDPFSDTHGDISAIGVDGSFDTRTTNTMSYTNKFGGIKVGVDLHMAELNAALSMGNSVGVTIPVGDHNIVLGTTTLTDGSSATKLGAAMKFGDMKVNFIYEMIDADSSNNMVLNAQMGGIALGYYSDGSTGDSQIAAGYFSKLDKSTKVGLVYTAVTGTSTGRLGKGVDGFSATPNGANSIQFILHHNF